jgi:hypothetical protein
MAVFNAVGLILAGFLVFLVAFYVTLVGGLLAYQSIKEALLRRRENRTA